MYGEVRSRPRMEPFTSSLDSVVEVEGLEIVKRNLMIVAVEHYSLGLKTFQITITIMN